MANSSGGGLAEGFQTGFSLAHQFNQAQEERRQQAWKNDMEAMTKGIELSNVKGITPQMRLQIMNNTVVPTWNKWHPDNPFPKLTAENHDEISPLIKDLGSIQEQVTGGKIDPSTGYGLATKRINQGMYEIENSDAERARTEKVGANTLSAIKFYGDEQDKQRDKNKTARDEEELALKRQTELGAQYANLQKTGSIDPEAAKKDPTLAAFASMFDKGKLTSTQIAAVGAVINREREHLNTKISDPRLRTPVMYSDEADILAKQKGYDPSAIHISHIVRPGSSPYLKKSDASGAPGAAPISPPMAQVPNPAAAAVAPVMPSLTGTPVAPQTVPQVSLTNPRDTAGYIG